MSMTRKDYVAVAAAIRNAATRTVGNDDYDVYNELVSLSWAAQYIADVMAKDNPRFDRDRFMAATGVSPAQIACRA